MYVPSIAQNKKRMPEGTVIDKRYDEIRYTDEGAFGPMEPLQYWIDIIDSGLSVSDVKLLGINGGTTASAEYNIAIALGVPLGFVEDSGGEAARILRDDDWGAQKMPACLPNDPFTVKTYIGSSKSDMQEEDRDTIARTIHDDYRHSRLSDAQKEDPAMAEWDKLPFDLQSSNRDQADNIGEKLNRIGCTVQKVTTRPVTLMTFTDKEVEIMAEMEHGRWNAERLLKGWTGAEERDHDKKTRPYIVSWSMLPEKVKEWDRRTVRNIPEFLAKVGLEIRREE